MEKELRRSQSTLQMLGIGVILFSLWDIVKPSLTILIGAQSHAAEEAAPHAAEISPFLIWLIAGVGAAYLIIIPLRFYIGLSARAEGRGKRRGWGYVILAFLCFTIQALLLVMMVAAIFYQHEVKDDTVASLLVESCSVYTIGQLAFTAVKVKRLSKALRPAG